MALFNDRSPSHFGCIHNALIPNEIFRFKFVPPGAVESFVIFIDPSSPHGDTTRQPQLPEDSENSTSSFGAEEDPQGTVPAQIQYLFLPGPRNSTPEAT